MEKVSLSNRRFLIEVRTLAKIKKDAIINGSFKAYFYYSSVQSSFIFRVYPYSCWKNGSEQIVIVITEFKLGGWAIFTQRACWEILI